MTKKFQMKLDSIQLSQLYISPEKLDRIMKSLERARDSDSEVVRTMVTSFLSEKGYLAKKEVES